MLIHMATIIKCDDVISEGYETETSARVPESDPGLSWMGAFVIVMMTSLTRLDLRNHHRQSLLYEWSLLFNGLDSCNRIQCDGILKASCKCAFAFLL